MFERQDEVVIIYHNQTRFQNYFYVFAACDVPDECKRTCAVPNPENCDNTRPEENIDGCSCKSGYVLSEIGGKCIPIEDCPSKYCLL